MSEKPPFWLVWCPTGRSPQYRHDSELSAESEADRLAKECPGQHFYVLLPVTEIVKTEMTIRRFNRDDIPF